MELENSSTQYAKMEDDEEHDASDTKDLDDLADVELPPHCFGHRFHWAEVFFFIALLGGGAMAGLYQMIEDAPDLIRTIVVIIYLSAALTATALMWNLISIKRIAAASEMLLQDVKKFREQNGRAKKLQEINKQNDGKMKQNLADLEKAGVLLKGSVQGLEDVQKQEEEMMEEREELLEKRREVAGRLETNMDKLWTLTIEAVRTELEKRVMNVFDDLSAPRESDGEKGVVVFSGEWDELLGILEEYGVKVDPNDSSPKGLKTLAGDDKFLNIEEFEEWWTNAENEHFTTLIKVLKTNRDLENRIRSLELGLPEIERKIS